MEKKYPIGGYAPGDYYCTCATCKTQFQGDKMAVQCEPCAVSAKERFDKLDPNEQDLLIKRNARIANFMFSGPLSPERELIYRIVEQWGNAIEMPKMEGWLKEYAKGASTGARWVKASEFKYEVGFAYHAKDSESKGAGRFDESGCFIWGDDSVTLPENQGGLLILDESVVKDDWISVDERLPVESGRYWCYVQHLTDLGFSYFQWNCDYNAQLQRFSDMTLKDGENVTHWRRLPPPPKTLPQWTQSNSLT
jgi:hypothetical protein